MQDGVLDFRAVDGIGFAAERGRLGALPPLMRLKADRLGPLLEVVQLEQSALLPREPTWLDPGLLDGLRRAVIEKRASWTAGGSAELAMMALAASATSNSWTVFAMGAKRAAIGAGFDSNFAGQMIAALRELEDNVREHAGTIDGAYLAYHATPGTFEFVVADLGRGVLETLREAPERATLASDGDALRAALTEGVSRFGEGKGRGLGYRPLFTGLVNRRAFLRFRSGAGGLVMDGVTPMLPSAQVGVKPRVSGLFVSVSCNLH